MENTCRSPKQNVEGYIQAGIHKAHASTKELFLLGFFAGVYIAFGAACSMLAIYGVENAGLAKLIAGVIFPVGLMLIVLVGGELFTGDCLMIMGVFDKQYSTMTMIKKLTIIYLSNLVGALVVVLIIKFSGQQDYGYGALGAYTIKAAYGKVSYTFVQAFFSGIACNIIVCAAMLMAYSSTTTVGKIFGVFFPIMIFITGNFEHCIANMYYIPAGILATLNETYVSQAMELYHLTESDIAMVNLQNFLFSNLLPVTLGNIVGGMLFMGLPLYMLHGKEKIFKKSSKK